MSNIISDFNEQNNPNTVDEVQLPDKAAKMDKAAQQSVLPQSVLPEGQLPTVVKHTAQDYPALPEVPTQQPVELGDFVRDPVTVEYNLPSLDLNSNVPTVDEVDQAYKEAGQAQRDWVSAQAANYTPAPVYDITAGGFDYTQDTPKIGMHIPDNLFWKENEEAAYQQAVAAEQARLNQQGYNIEPQTNVTQQQGGFNTGQGGTAQQGWTIGGAFNDVVGGAMLLFRGIQSTAEGAIGRPIQNPLDVAEAVVRANPLAMIQEGGAAVLSGQGQQYLDKYKASFTNNFQKKPLTPNEVNLLAGGIAQTGPVNLSRGKFGDYGSGVMGAVNYGLDNFVGGNAIIRGPVANIKRNIENAANGRPQQWDEGLGIIAGLKGKSYSALDENNKDTYVLGKDKHGTEFWLRAGGGFIYDAVTDLSPLAIVKQGIKKGGRLALKQSIKNIPAATVSEMVDAGQVIVEVTKKGGVPDVKSVNLGTILSPEKRMAYEKQGLVVVGAKQVGGPSAKKLEKQALRDAKKTAKGKKVPQRKTPNFEYEFITMKRSELVEKSVNTLTPSTGDVLNKVSPTPNQLPAAKPTTATEILDGYRVPVDPKTGKKIYPLDASGNPITTSEGLKAVRQQQIAQKVNDNPLLYEVVHHKKKQGAVGKTSLVDNTASKVDNPTTQKTQPELPDVIELPPVTKAVKEAVSAPELPQNFKAQLAQPGAAENILKQAEVDGTIRVEPDGTIKDLDTPNVSDDIAEAQKELIRLRIEQNRLKETPNFDLVGSPGTKIGKQVQELQEQIDAVRQRINPGKVRREFYEQDTTRMSGVELERVIPAIPHSYSNPLPVTPSTLFTTLKNDNRVFLPGEMVERSLDDLSALAEYLGHKSRGATLSAADVDDLRREYGMVYSRVGEPINKESIRQYLDTGVGRILTKAETPTNPVRETMLMRRGLGVVDGGSKSTPRTTKLLSVVDGGGEKAVEDMSLEELFSEVETIGSRYDSVKLPEAERFASNRVASEFVNELLNPVRDKFAAGAENLGVQRSGEVVPLRPQAGDNVLEINRNGGKKYQYLSTGEAAPERGVYQKLELLTAKRDELLDELDNPNANVAEVQKQLDQVSLEKQRLEQLEPKEARAVAKYMENMPEPPKTKPAEDAALVVRESEQLVQDTTQRIRDINTEIESVRANLDKYNEYLRSKPPIEPQALDVGNYELGTVNERIVNSVSNYNSVRLDRPLTQLGKEVRERVYWFGSSFDDAVQYNPLATRPTRNPYGLGHYLHNDGGDAEEAARALLPDNFPEAGLTPNESGVVQQFTIPEARNPLDVSDLDEDSVIRDLFDNAIQESFEPDEYRKLVSYWRNHVEELPVANYWDSVTTAWGKRFPSEPVPEDKFRLFEVAVSNKLMEMGYDSIHHSNGVVVLDHNLLEELGEQLVLPDVDFARKALATSNVEKRFITETSEEIASIRVTAAKIDAGEAYIDNLMGMLSDATKQNDVALEQLFRNQDRLKAILESDNVAKALAAQEEAATKLEKETNKLLKQNDEHPGCL